MHKALAGALIVLAAVAGVAQQRALAQDDAAKGYEAIRPSLVKVWAFDRAGHPKESGSGVIVVSTGNKTLVLTATHVIANAASIRIDVSRDIHDLVAHVDRTGPRDLTLLSIDRGGLHAAHFAPRSRPVVEGNMVAVAGYVKHDELIGVVGQEPRVLFPGTISSRPDNGTYLELENLHIEEGLSGGPVFDPANGDVLGIVTSRTTDGRGGFADSGALIVSPFLAAGGAGAVPLAVAAAVARTPRPAVTHLTVAAGAPPAPVEKPAVALAVHPAAHAAPKRADDDEPFMAPMTFDNGRTFNPASTVAAVPTLAPAPIPTPAPVRTLPPAPVPTMTPPPAVIGYVDARPGTGDDVAWQAVDGASKRFVFRRGTCRVALTLTVHNLQFHIARGALNVSKRPGALLAMTLEQRAVADDACDNVADSEPVDGNYVATATSYDGRHVTMRFSAAGDDDDAQLFPADASLDVDLTGDRAIATLQFFDTDWSGSISVPLAHTQGTLATVQ